MPLIAVRRVGDYPYLAVKKREFAVCRDYANDSERRTGTEPERSKNFASLPDVSILKIAKSSLKSQEPRWIRLQLTLQVKLERPKPN